MMRAYYTAQTKRNTGIISEEISDWLNELIISPEIYERDENGNWILINRTE